MESVMVLLTCFLALLLLPFHVCPESKGSHRGIVLSYVCRSSARIDLEFSGSDFGSIRYGLGVCGKQSMVVNFTSGTNHGTLSGCEKHVDIYVYLYNHQPVYDRNTSAIQTFVLHCNAENKPLTAVFRNRSMESPQSRRAFSENTTPPGLIMALVNVSGSSRTIVLGGQYTLRISGTYNYTVFPESCYAASDETFQRQVTLLENGCTRDKTLMTGFHQNGTQPIVEATLHGFHLVYSNTVYIQCVVNLCPTSKCQIKPVDFSEADCNIYGYITDNNTSNSMGVVLSQRVGTSFTVIDPALDISNSASVMSITTSVLLLAVCSVLISFQSCVFNNMPKIQKI